MWSRIKYQIVYHNFFNRLYIESSVPIWIVVKILIWFHCKLLWCFRLFIWWRNVIHYNVRRCICSCGAIRCDTSSVGCFSKTTMPSKLQDRKNHLRLKELSLDGRPCGAVSLGCSVATELIYTNLFLIKRNTRRFITNSTNIKTPWLVLQISVKRNKSFSGDIMNEIPSMLQVTPITINNRKYIVKLKSK